MTEREYIDATDLGKIRSTISAMQNIVPENMSKSNAKKLRKAYGLIYDIQDSLFKKVKTEE